MKPLAVKRRAPAFDGPSGLQGARATGRGLRILALPGNDEICVCHVHDGLELPRPTVSRHLRLRP